MYNRILSVVRYPTISAYGASKTLTIPGSNPRAMSSTAASLTLAPAARQNRGDSFTVGKDHQQQPVVCQMDSEFSWPKGRAQLSIHDAILQSPTRTPHQCHHESLRKWFLSRLRIRQMLKIRRPRRWKEAISLLNKVQCI